MKSDNNIIPENMFTWLSTLNFSELSEQERTVVLQHFDESEYNEMRAGLTGITEVRNSENERKTELLRIFESQHAQEIRLPRKENRARIFLLRVAAIVIPFLLLVLFVPLFHPAAFSTEKRLTATDTVFVDKIVEVPVNSIPDTIIKVVFRASAVSTVKKEMQNEKNFEPQDDFSIVTIEDVNRPENINRGSSLQGDSLFRKFEPASL